MNSSRYWNFFWRKICSTAARSAPALLGRLRDVDPPFRVRAPRLFIQRDDRAAPELHFPQQVEDFRLRQAGGARGHDDGRAGMAQKIIVQRL